MDQQVMETQLDSDADAIAAFERMSGQLATLAAAVDGFAARQTRIEQRDYSQDLAQLTERQDKMIGAINTLADRPGAKLTPDGFAESVGRAAAKLRAPDQAALASAQASMDYARAAMAGVVVSARTKQAQRDAMIWAVTIAMGATALLLALAPLLINTLWPAAAGDRAAAILHKSRWEAGMELMASGDPARWRQLVDADTFQHETAQAVAACPQPCQLGYAAGALCDRDQTGQQSIRPPVQGIAQKGQPMPKSAMLVIQAAFARPSRKYLGAGFWHKESCGKP